MNPFPSEYSVTGVEKKEASINRMAKSKKSKSGSSKKLDVRSSRDVPMFESLIKKGPMTIVLIHADWCGHCQRFQDAVWNKVPNSSTNTMNMAGIHHDMLENTSLSGAKLKGYPSLLLVGKDGKPAIYKDEEGEETNAMPQPNTPEDLEKMVNTPVETEENINILSNAVNAVNAENTVNSYKPIDMNVVPPSAVEDLVTSQKPNQKQMGGNLYRSLLKIMAQATSSKKNTRRRYRPVYRGRTLKKSRK